MDINFFEEFNIEKTSKKKLVLFIFIPVSIIIILALIIINNQINISGLEDEIQLRSELIDNPITVTKLEELKDIKSELNASKDEIENLNSLDRFISEKDYLDHNVLEEYLIIDGIIISSVNFNENIIQISGSGVNPIVIADYTTILRESTYIEKVHISSIDLEERYYNFTIIITLKGDNFETLN